MSEGRISDLWGGRTPYQPGDEWPQRVDQHLADGVREEDVEAWVPTASLLHSNGDAMDIAVAGGRIVRRPRQPRPARRQGSLRVGCEQLHRPADHAAGAAGR
jgi:hypothetical protein